MSYKIQINIPNLKEGETAVLLSTGELVAVSCFVKRQIHTNNVVYCSVARAIDKHGSTMRDAHGYDIKTEMRHAACDAEVQTHGDAAMRRECMMLVLGEPLTVLNGEPMVAWSDGIITQSSIRRAAAAAVQTTSHSASVL
jgi:hypothetical protein